MRTVARSLAFLVLVTVVASAAPAAADETPNPQADAQKAMERGVEAAKKGDHAEALAQYRRAAELVPEANLPHRYAAESCVELRRYDEAIAEYDTYLRIKPTVQDAPTVRARMDEIRSKYVEGVLDVECTPEGAQVFVDDESNAAGTTPLRSLRLRAGAHRLTVRIDGYRDGTWPTQVAAGSTRVVQCALTPLDAGPATASSAGRDGTHAPPPKKSGGLLTTWWFWTGVGVLAAGAGVTVFALTQKSADAPRTDGGTLRFP